MKESTQDKQLVDINDKSIFYRIRRFLIKLFKKDEIIENKIVVEERKNEKKENEENSFLESLKKIENEETKLLKLQKQYHNGEIKEEELTAEQVESLCDLYDKQISNLKKINEIKRQKIFAYKKRIQAEG